MKVTSLLPDDVLEQLKAGASPKKQRSLDLIHSICKAQLAAGKNDFSVATIGRLSADRGGPSPQPIRNKAGEAYRVLLAAWANFACTTTRKPAAQKNQTFSNDLMEMIDDPSIRVLVGSILAELRKLRNENAILKKQADIVIDRRQYSEQQTTHNTVVQIIPNNNLNQLEIAALKDLLDKDFITRMGWTVDKETGRITKGLQPIFRPGFLSAIKKIISNC